MARGRGVPIAQVREGMGQGRVLGAEAAQAQGMVDGLATFDEVVKKMRRDARSGAKPRASRLAQAGTTGDRDSVTRGSDLDYRFLTTRGELNDWLRDAWDQ